MPLHSLCDGSGAVLINYEYCTNLLASFNIQENIEDIIDHEMKFYVYDDPYLLTSFNIPEDAGHVAAGCEDLIVVQKPGKYEILELLWAGT